MLTGVRKQGLISFCTLNDRFSSNHGLLPMQRPATYIGDIRFQTLLSNAGIARPLAEIRAIIMRDIWRLDSVSPRVTMNEILGKDFERTFPDQAGAKQFFEQFLALWNALAKHQDEKQPFRLSTFPVPKTTATLVVKLRGRIAEIKCLLPLFDIDAANTPRWRRSWAKRHGISEGFFRTSSRRSKPSNRTENGLRSALQVLPHFYRYWTRRLKLHSIALLEGSPPSGKR